MAKLHGLSKHRLFHVFRHIKDRCYNPNNDSYHNYGARGIIVCDEWKNDFMAFYNWALENGYKKGLTIDRIENNGSYSPTNCRLATRKTQGNNRSTNRFLERDGERLTMKQWSEKTGIHYETIKKRVREGLPVDMVLSPINRHINLPLPLTKLKRK